MRSGPTSNEANWLSGIQSLSLISSEYLLWFSPSNGTRLSPEPAWRSIFWTALLSQSGWIFILGFNFRMASSELSFRFEHENDHQPIPWWCAYYFMDSCLTCLHSWNRIVNVWIVFFTIFGREPSVWSFWSTLFDGIPGKAFRRSLLGPDLYQLFAEGIQSLTDHWHDPFLSSVISMVAPTRCHGPTWGNPLWEIVELTWSRTWHFSQ